MEHGQGEAAATLHAILDEHGLSVEFPPPVLREVEAIQRDPGIDDPALADLTHLPFVTIDYADSRDLDQAMHLEREADGFVVRYALADAAHYVRPGSALFDEALARGVSYYLPGLTVPMLPPELSEGIVSLLPGVDRRALVFVLHLDHDGRTRRTEVVRGRIRSRAKLSYDGVQAHHDDPGSSPLAGQLQTETLELLGQVGRLRIAEARGRDVIHFDRVETEVDLQDGGSAFCVRVERRNDVSRWNEQISLLCNIEGARLLAARGGEREHVQPVYRVHEPPEPVALQRLQRMMRRMVQAHGLAPSLGDWRRDGAQARESLADYLDRLRSSETPRRVVDAIERQALYTGQRSTFSAEPGRHYALGVSPYARFSAPMREIVGVFTHKEALELLGLEPPRATDERDERLREQVIAAANTGKERQRRIGKRVTGAFIDQLLGGDLELPLERRATRRGTVLGLNPSRLYVQLDDPPVEVKVYTEELGPCRLEDEISLVPEQGDGCRFTLGDSLALRTAGRDSRGRWRLAPLP